MSSDKKQKKQNRKDKKRRQAREKRGTLPVSVQALLGYLGNGGPTPAPQSDIKVRERAGIDNIDTLSQIIRQQQIQSSSYMQNLQQMAFKNDIQQQLKTQGDESKKVLEETRAEVAQVRQYNKKSTEEKIKKVEGQIANQLKLKSGPNPEKMAQLEANLKRYEGLGEFESRGKELKVPSYNSPSGAVQQKDMSLPKAIAQAGGGLSKTGRALSVPRARQQEFRFESAPTSSKLLSAVDVNAPLYDYARQQNIQFEPFVSGGQADIWDSILMYQSNLDGGVSSGNPALYDKPSISSNTGELRVRTSVIKSLTADEARNSLTPSEISNIRSKPWSPAGGKVSSGPISKPKGKKT